MENVFIHCFLYSFSFYSLIFILSIHFHFIHSFSFYSFIFILFIHFHFIHSFSFYSFIFILFIHFHFIRSFIHSFIHSFFHFIHSVGKKLACLSKSKVCFYRLCLVVMANSEQTLRYLYVDVLKAMELSFLESSCGFPLHSGCYTRRVQTVYLFASITSNG